jgi:septal ring factor EnvC (AmiA/AmiB activator)
MPMTIFHRGVRPKAWGSLLLVFVLAGTAAPAADDPNPARAEAELKAVRSQIDKVRAEMERDAGRRDKLTREIEESEQTVSSARVSLEKLKRERTVHTRGVPSSPGSGVARKRSSDSAAKRSPGRSARPR